MATLFVLATLLLAVPGEAESGRWIVVVQTSEERLDDRLRTELGSFGWPVANVQTQGADSLAGVARRSGAVAVLRPQPGGAAVEVWIEDPSTGETAFHEFVTVASPEQVDVLALRVVEVLRARFVRLGIIVSDAPAPPPAPPPAPEASERWLWWGAGVLGTYSPGGVGSQVDGVTELRLEPSPRWSVGMLAALSVVPARVAAAEGRADVHTGLAAVVGEWSAPREHRLGLRLGLGAGGVRLTMRGSAEPPFSGRSDAVGAVAAFVRAGLEVRLTPALRLRADLLGGHTAPTPTIRFAGREVAEWGRPFGGGGLKLELGMLARGAP